MRMADASGWLVSAPRRAAFEPAEPGQSNGGATASDPRELPAKCRHHTFALHADALRWLIVKR